MDKFKKIALDNDKVQRELSDICGYTNLNGNRSIDYILELLSHFHECIGYSNNRRGRTVIDLSSEAAVQDLLFFMLKPSIPDLIPEYPSSTSTRQYSIQDFKTKELGTIIEAKYIRDKPHGKSVKKELNDDINTYIHDEDCDTLIFFIYDPSRHIESRAGMKKAIDGLHSFDNRASINVVTIIV